MAFQILDSNGDTVRINQLDIEAAAFWNKEVDIRSYATPEGRRGNNWFDTIGWEIHNPHSKWTSGWNNVKCGLLAIQTEEFGTLPVDKQLVELVAANEFLEPFFKLIDHWSSKGYTPKQLVG